MLKKNSIRSLYFYLTILCLSLPFWGHLLQLNKAEHIIHENRAKISWSDQHKSLISIHKTLLSLVNYFNDQYYLRSHFIFYYQEILARAFKKSSTDLTYIGNDGWLFYRYLEYANGTRKIDQKRVLQFLQLRFERAKKLQQRNMKYVLIIPPYTGNLFSKFIPKSSFKHHISLLSSLEYQLQSLSEQGLVPTNFFFVNLNRFFLTIEKDLYFKADHHWTDQGSYLAFKEILKTLNIQINPGLKAEIDAKFSYGHGGIGQIGHAINWKEKTLVPIIDILNHFCPDTDSKSKLEKVKPNLDLNQFYGGNGYEPHFWSKIDFLKCQSPVAVPMSIYLEGDSFMAHLLPYLSYQFSNIQIKNFDSLHTLKNVNTSSTFIEEIWEFYLLKAFL